MITRGKKKKQEKMKNLNQHKTRKFNSKYTF